MKQYIASRYDLFLQDLETVVNIDSGSYYLPGVEQVADYFENRFSALGWYSQKHRFIERFGTCLEAANRDPSSPKTRYDLLCIGHMDTVFSEGTVRERPFSITADKGLGPGVSDMKAGLVTVLHVVETLQKFGVTDRLSLCVAFNGDEEIGSPASREWIETLARRSQRVFVFEPGRTSGHRVLQRKGTGSYRIHCYGKSAHAGVEPTKGINAVVEIAHQILKIDTFGNPELGTTVNVNVVSGGTKTNVIPDYAKASVDIRVAERSEATRIEQLFRDLPKQTSVTGVSVKVSGGLNRPPMLPSQETLQLWEKMVAIGKKSGLQMQWKATGGGSDGNFTAALGIPTIDALGPIGGNAHSSDEYLELNSIIPTVQFICDFCRALVDKNLE